MYDIIGDIHGQADMLRQLLSKLGYQENNGTYSHPSRTVIFVGDFIDGKGEHRETLAICRSMIDRGNALAVMGNHEFNAICYATPDGSGNYLRPHTDKNIRDHAEFIAEYPFHSREHLGIIQWLRSLPVFLDLGELRIIHAVWHHHELRVVKPWLDNRNCLLSDAYIHALDKGHNLYQAIETLLKVLRKSYPLDIAFRTNGVTSVHPLAFNGGMSRQLTGKMPP